MRLNPFKLNHRRLLYMPILALTSTAWAFHGRKHVTGTIASVHDTSIAITLKSGTLATLQINPATLWLKGLNEVKPEEVKVGDRVVIMTTGKGSGLLATEITTSPLKGKH